MYSKQEKPLSDYNDKAREAAQRQRDLRYLRSMRKRHQQARAQFVAEVLRGDF